MKTKTRRRRAAAWVALLALLLAGLLPIAASAAVAPIGPDGSFPAPDNASETTVCTALGEYLEVGDVRIDAKRVEWPPESTTASTDQLDGYQYLVLKSGQVYEFFDFTPTGYTGQLLANGAGTKFNISNITGCAFGRTPSPELPELELLKVWQDGQGVPLSPVTDVTWSASVLYGNGDAIGIEIGRTKISDTGDFASGRTRYQVVEPAGEGFTEVACSEYTMARVNSAYAAGRIVNFDGTGTFSKPVVDTLHVICNTPDEPDEPDFYIDVDKVVTGNTAPSTAEFEICVETFSHQEPVARAAVSDVSNGELVPPAYLQCETFGHGDEFRFGELWPGDFRVWEREAVPDPLSIGYSGDGAPVPEFLDGVVVELTQESPTASVTVTNRYRDEITRLSPSYYLDFEKDWSLDTVGGRLSNLDTDGYNASFDVVSLDDEVVTVDVDDVTLSAGGQSVAADARRSVSLNTGYLLEESFGPLGDNLPCIIDTTFSYDGEVLEANDDGEVIFTTPTFAVDGTTFTIDVANEVVCDAVLDEVVESVEVEAVKAWYQTSDDGLVELDEAPEGAEPSYEVVVKGPDAQIVLVDELDAGAMLVIPDLVDGETYLLTWEEIDPLDEFELDGATCTWSEEESEYVGSETFVAGEVDTVSFTGINAYDCLEVLDTVVTPTPTAVAMPRTGASTLWLTLLGLLGMGLGGGLLSRRRVR